MCLDDVMESEKISEGGHLGQVVPGLGPQVQGAASLPLQGQVAAASGQNSFAGIVGQHPPGHGHIPPGAYGGYIRQGAVGQLPAVAGQPWQVQNLQVRQHGGGLTGGQGRGRLGSTGSKRSRDEREGGTEQVDQQQSGQDHEGYQPVRRRRKANVGRNSITVPGAEAAPIEIFIGNTNPRATEDLIKQVLVMAMDGMSGKPADLAKEDIKVECKNNLTLEPNPRTKCWKVTVPYLFKDIMEKDEFFPSGWSHRKWFSGNGKNASQNKRPRQDPIQDLIDGHQAGSGPATGAVPKIIVTGSGNTQTGLDQDQNM